MTLLRIIAIFIIIYLIFRVITMYVMPWLLRKFIERQRKKFYGDDPKSKRRSSQKKKDYGDEVNVNIKNKRQITSDDIGEYVDYKEIKDKDTKKSKKKKE